MTTKKQIYQGHLDLDGRIMSVETKLEGKNFGIPLEKDDEVIVLDMQGNAVTMGVYGKYNELDGYLTVNGATDALSDKEMIDLFGKNHTVIVGRDRENEIIPKVLKESAPRKSKHLLNLENA